MTDEVAELQGEVLPGETGEVEKPEEATTSESEETPAEPQQPKEAKGVQKRINELTANWREEQRQKQQLLDQNLELQRRLTQAPEKEATSEPTAEPKLEDYSSYEEFVDARADFRAEQKVNEKFEAWKAEQSQATEVQTQAEQRQAFDNRAQTFAESHPDFDEVARNPNLPVTPGMAELLNVSEKGPELLYHLGQNPGEAARLASLPQGQAAMELGRIEAQLSVLQPNTQTSAPPVIEPLTDGQGSKTKDPDEMTTSEWQEWRNAQIAARNS